MLNMDKKQLTEDDIIHVCNLIKRGEKLPDKYREFLFGREIKKQEYELRYGCKERENDIIADTFWCPLQKIKTFEPDKVIDHRDYVREPETAKEFIGWHNKLIFWDNLQVLKTILTDKVLQKQIKDNGGIKLIYIDPPFATKQDFQNSKWEKAYSDKIAWAEFIEFLRKRFILMRELLAEDGSLYVHMDYKKSHYIKIILDEIFWEHWFQNNIVWKRDTPRWAKAKGTHFPRVTDVILYYVKSDKYIWNPQYKEYSESIMKRYKQNAEWRWYRLWDLGDYSEESIKKFEALDRIYITKNGKKQLVRWLDEENWEMISDIFTDIPLVNPMAKERINYPTQKPEALLERFIRASSNEWDIVLDAFAGSGTTIATAEKLWRKWIGIDCGKLAIYTVQKRLLNLKKEIGNRGEPLKPKPFAVYNAGLYDFQEPWKSCLQE